ncbi:AAC(3)-I family aminoglycoside N-acetyltransferase [Vibrio ulleungensis]|uniref:AAC(3)-I family aminoglycoside N-acetyltransferase n=1 Tax=Vibrio ulleungensis TaxID=2807619 RepID=A0ABS2HEJ5_9VIBR|nr:AAC(3)-I family aminoglycoside N-acetyltransferase [Vibrio ulleungensis]MBM7035046.1 AAC(3)-I family aminoglycoside N-acetyltransferase [Vibrio ulleungensis]
MAINYVQLNGDHLEWMKQLMDCFGTVFEEPENYGHKRPTDAYLTERLNDPSFIALVALEGDQVVAGLVAYELKKFEQARSEVYIYDLGVYERFRRQGIATGLINALKPIAKNMGAWVIFVQADYVDEPAIKLYDSLGEKEEVLHFDIPVQWKP